MNSAQVSYIIALLLLPSASYSGFPMDSMKSSYSSGLSSGYSGGYSGGYGSGSGSYGGGFSSGGFSSGGFSSSSGSAGGYSTTQSKKNVVIKMIETKDGRVVSESSEVIED